MDKNHILIVEDDADIRSGIEIYLKNQGYDVSQAGDGIEGLAGIEKEEIDLAIVDIMMPRRDYDQFLEYMKIHRKEYPDLRIFNLDECKEYPYMITRISDDRYIIKMENEKPYGMGVFIDIYPYDGLGTTEKAAVTYGKKVDRLTSLCNQSTREQIANETTTSLL